MLSPDAITTAQFDSTLLCYPALLKALSASKAGTCASPCFADPGLVGAEIDSDIDIDALAGEIVC